ncbi:hydrocephalus-inducing like protein, putative [Babesia ovata]|uniref:Hydrocephalus-inducing like protein, putative n=1 Tax=Babesia ovata TaxID=189622 RepID=A0A2H6KFG9_9APIC|nr:hydrocephalus-inducing like protein, putative [Babesia ovata]GBE61735.1 hydrocephalus-inducing like protein, putative [Babesia ovata]
MHHAVALAAAHGLVVRRDGLTAPGARARVEHEQRAVHRVAVVTAEDVHLVVHEAGGVAADRGRVHVAGAVHAGPRVGRNVVRVGVVEVGATAVTAIHVQHPTVSDHHVSAARLGLLAVGPAQVGPRRGHRVEAVHVVEALRAVVSTEAVETVVHAGNTMARTLAQHLARAIDVADLHIHGCIRVRRVERVVERRHVKGEHVHQPLTAVVTAVHEHFSAKHSACVVVAGQTCRRKLSLLLRPRQQNVRFLHAQVQAQPTALHCVESVRISKWFLSNPTAEDHHHLTHHIAAVGRTGRRRSWRGADVLV